MAWWWPFGRNQSTAEQPAPSETPSTAATTSTATVNRAVDDEPRGLPAMDSAGGGSSVLRTVARPGIATGREGPALKRDAARFGHGRGFESFAFRLIERHGAAASSGARQTFARSLPTLMSYDTATVAPPLQRTPAEAPSSGPYPIHEAIAAAEGSGRRTTSTSANADMRRLSELMAMHEAQGTSTISRRPAPPTPETNPAASEIRRLAPATPGDVPRSTPARRRRITEGKNLSDLPLPAPPPQPAASGAEPVPEAPVARMPAPLRATATRREAPTSPPAATPGDGSLDRNTDVSPPVAPAPISPDDAIQRAIAAAERPSGSDTGADPDEDGGEAVARIPDPGPAPTPSPATGTPPPVVSERGEDASNADASTRMTVEPQTRGDAPSDLAPPSLVLRETPPTPQSSPDAETRTSDLASERSPTHPGTGRAPSAATPSPASAPPTSQASNVSPSAGQPAASETNSETASSANPAIQRAPASPGTAGTATGPGNNSSPGGSPPVVQPSQPERAEPDASLPLVERQVTEHAPEASANAAIEAVQRTAASPLMPSTQASSPDAPTEPGGSARGMSGASAESRSVPTTPSSLPTTSRGSAAGDQPAAPVIARSAETASATPPATTPAGEPGTDGESTTNRAGAPETPGVSIPSTLEGPTVSPMTQSDDGSAPIELTLVARVAEMTVESGAEPASHDTARRTTEGQSPATGTPAASAPAPGALQRQSEGQISSPSPSAPSFAAGSPLINRTSAPGSAESGTTARSTATVSPSRAPATAVDVPALTVVRPLQPEQAGALPASPSLLRTADRAGATNPAAAGGAPAGSTFGALGAKASGEWSDTTLQRVTAGEADTEPGDVADTPVVVALSRGSAASAPTSLALRETAPGNQPFSAPGTTTLLRTLEGPGWPTSRGNSTGEGPATVRPRQATRSGTAPTLFRSATPGTAGPAPASRLTVIDRLPAPESAPERDEHGAFAPSTSLVPLAPASIPAPVRTLARPLPAPTSAVSTTLRRTSAGRETDVADRVEFPSRARETSMPLSNASQRPASAGNAPAATVQRSPGLDLAVGRPDGAAGAEINRAEEASGTVVSASNTPSDDKEKFDIEEYLPKIADAVWQEFRRRLRSERERARGRL